MIRYLRNRTLGVLVNLTDAEGVLTRYRGATMAKADTEREFVDYAVDLMQTIGPVSARRMFGGYGIFLDGLMFALVADSILYLKTDAESVGAFTELGLEAFTYSKKGKPYRMSYHQAPEACLEDVDAMSRWANRAYEAAMRAAAGKRRH